MAISKKHNQAVFERLVDACGAHVAHGYNDVGGWRLDYNGLYGGYNIEEIANESGGVRQPFGATRMKAAVFADAMHFALRAIEYSKK